MDEKTTIQDLKNKVREFAEARDWDQFHNAKDLAIGIITEASELLEPFRFKTKEEVEEMFKNPIRREYLEDEVADILYFVIRLAQKYNIDISSAITHKMKKSEKKYPIEKSRGSNKKYTEFK